MPIINFKSEFINLIASGKLRYAIVPTRKRKIKIGDKLYLKAEGGKNLFSQYNPHYPAFVVYKGCQYAHVICQEVTDIEMTTAECDFGVIGYWIQIGFMKEVFLEKHDIYKRLCFNAPSEMIKYLKINNMLPFKGQLVRW